MNHIINEDIPCPMIIGQVRVYAVSYEVSRDRRYSFQNRSLNGLYFTDNGAYPAYLKIKGFVLKSECSCPGVRFNEIVESNTSVDMVFDGIYYNQLKIKSYTVRNDPQSHKIECELTLCCSGYMIELKVE